jgi:pre-mRNA-splicing factor SYF2
MLRSQAEAEERGEDVERSKNWEWTIEDNENWEKKKARKARRADYEFHGGSSGFLYETMGERRCSPRIADDAHAARRRYKKDLDLLKPDLEVYNRQKELVLGLVSGTLSQSGSSTPSGSSFALTTFDVAGSQVCVSHVSSCEVDVTLVVHRWSRRQNSGWLWTTSTETLTPCCMPTTSLLRMPSIELSVKLTKSKCLVCPDLDPSSFTPCSIDKKAKFSRKRLNEEEGDITYINERNRVFNKKVRKPYCPETYSKFTTSYFRLRLLGTTTSTQRRFVQASSAEPPYRQMLLGYVLRTYHLYWSVYGRLLMCKPRSRLMYATYVTAVAAVLDMYQHSAPPSRVYYDIVLLIVVYYSCSLCQFVPLNVPFFPPRPSNFLRD